MSAMNKNTERIEPTAPPPTHPAKFTRTILEVLHDVVVPGRILDPFAGTGRIHELGADLFTERDTIGVELEPEWAAFHHRTIVGNALALPFADGSFDGVVTSCTYGNRLADHHEVRDTSIRHSYTFDLGRPLHPDNSGNLQWGDEYRRFHERAWREVFRVVRPQGQFVLNIKDHIRAREVQPVTEWHTQTITTLGFTLEQQIPVTVPNLVFGTNSERVPNEWVLVFKKASVQVH